ncbi:MAG: thioredoxin family protein [Bacilli bacterium]|nr:thioredoxin family protein [Bacilli bacterium]
MKKWKIIGIVVLVLVLVVLSFVVSSKGGSGDGSYPEPEITLSNDVNTIIENAQEESASVTENQKKKPTEIRVADYIEFKADSEPRIILVARPTCGYCNIAEPIIYKISKEYDLDIYYLNTDEFTEAELTDFVQSDERFQELGTPYLMVVQDDEIIDNVDGLTDYAHYVDFFQRNGFID